MCDYAVAAKECASVVVLLNGAKLDGLQFEELSFFTVAETYCLAMAKVCAARTRLAELEGQLKLKQEETATTSATELKSLESLVEDAREELSLAEVMAEGGLRGQTQCALHRWLILVFYDSCIHGCGHIEEAKSALPSYRDSVAAVKASSLAEAELGKLESLREQLVDTLARALRASVHAARLMAKCLGNLYLDFSVTLIEIFEQVLALIKEEEDCPTRGNLFGLSR
jgi:hypothetical protein